MEQLDQLGSQSSSEIALVKQFKAHLNINLNNIDELPQKTSDLKKDLIKKKEVLPKLNPTPVYKLIKSLFAEKNATKWLASKDEKLFRTNLKSITKKILDGPPTSAKKRTENCNKLSEFLKENKAQNKDIKSFIENNSEDISNNITPIMNTLSILAKHDIPIKDHAKQLLSLTSSQPNNLDQTLTQASHFNGAITKASVEQCISNNSQQKENVDINSSNSEEYQNDETNTKGL